MNTFTRMLGAAVTIVAIQCSAWAGTIKGYITGPDFKPVAGARVNILNNNRIVDFTYTKHDGSYSIGNLPGSAGYYSVHAFKPIPYYGNIPIQLFTPPWYEGNQYNCVFFPLRRSHPTAHINIQMHLVKTR